MSTTTERTTADKLRAVADLLDAHPDLPPPCVWSYAHSGVSVQWQLMNDDDAKDDQRAAARRIMRAIGGKWTKNPWGDRFDFEQVVDGIKVEICASREQVCGRRVVGTEEVTHPAVEAQPERTETREVVEWDCSPVLAEAVA